MITGDNDWLPRWIQMLILFQTNNFRLAPKVILVFLQLIMLLYFNKNNPAFSIKVKVDNTSNLQVSIMEYTSKQISWEQTSKDERGTITYTVNKPVPGGPYLIYANDILLKKSKANGEGQLQFVRGSKKARIKVLLLL